MSHITAEQIGRIADQYEYPDDQIRKACIDKMNNNIFLETRLYDLHKIARRYACPNEVKKG